MYTWYLIRLKIAYLPWSRWSSVIHSKQGSVNPAVLNPLIPDLYLDLPPSGAAVTAAVLSRAVRLLLYPILYVRAPRSGRSIQPSPGLVADVRVALHICFSSHNANLITRFGDLRIRLASMRTNWFMYSGAGGSGEDDGDWGNLRVPTRNIDRIWWKTG